MEVFAVFFLIAVFLCVIILTPLFLRARERMKLIELVKSGSERGEPLPPDLLRTLMSEPRPNRPSHIRDRRRGIVLISLAIAIELIALCIYLAISYAESDPQEVGEAIGVGLSIAGFGAIPACVGLAFILLSVTGKDAVEP